MEKSSWYRLKKCVRLVTKRLHMNCKNILDVSEWLESIFIFSSDQWPRIHIFLLWWGAEEISVKIIDGTGKK